MIRRLALLAAAAAAIAGMPMRIAAAPPSSVAQTTTPSALTILRNARRVFRDVKRPPYVVYTMVREAHLDDFFDSDDSYTLRIWYRAQDGGALSRRVPAGTTTASGPLNYLHPLFDAPIDPGPPDADIFEKARTAAQIAAPTPPPGQPALPQIGAITVEVEQEYRPRLLGTDNGRYDLELVPRRDPDRNRLREMWVDTKTWRVTRFLSADKLFYIHTNVVVPLIFDVRMEQLDGVPIVRSIHARVNGDDPIRQGNTNDDFTFRDISFPATLPDWYFDPRDYKQNASAAPQT